MRPGPGAFVSLSEPGEHHLAEGALKYFRIRSTVDLLAVAALLVMAIFWLLPKDYHTAAFSVLVLMVSSACLFEIKLLNNLRVRYTTYTVTREYVYISRGFIFRRTTMIATPQILNVESLQGPLLRRMNLVKVKFVCIADVESLGPISPQAAERIRERVIGTYSVEAGARD